MVLATLRRRARAVVPSARAAARTAAVSAAVLSVGFVLRRVFRFMCDVAEERDRIEQNRRPTATTRTAAMLDTQGFLVRRSAASATTVATLRAALEAEAARVEKGGYAIWTPAEALPAACLEWARTEAAAILQRSLPPGTPAVRLLGGAALWKRAGVDDGTPWHQDFAYAEERAPGSTRSRTTRHAAVWLALTPAGPTSGCLRFAPSRGFSLQPHKTLPRAEAPSGFETHMVGRSVLEAAEAAAEDCVLDPGDACIIGDQIVHGSRPTHASEPTRLAFSPLFEVDCMEGCPLPAGYL